MRILVTGSSSQLGEELLNQINNSKDLHNHEIINPTRQELDLANEKLCEKFILNKLPDLVINLAAYTAVENAEKNIEDAFKINALALKAFSKSINKIGGYIIHISTDYVFDGKNNIPYTIRCKRNPLNIYGKSKAKGEEYLENILRRNQFTIIRTSWLVSKYGNNFVKTILNKLKSKDNKSILKIVSDQRGCITTSKSLSKLIINLIRKKSRNESIPTHLHWSSQGDTNWFEIAKSIKIFAKELKIIESEIEIVPIKSYQYKGICPRPKFSLLNISETERFIKIKSRFWKEELKNLLIEIKNNKINN